MRTACASLFWMVFLKCTTYTELLWNVLREEKLANRCAWVNEGWKERKKTKKWRSSFKICFEAAEFAAQPKCMYKQRGGKWSSHIQPGSSGKLHINHSLLGRCCIFFVLSNTLTQMFLSFDGSEHCFVTLIHSLFPLSTHPHTHTLSLSLSLARSYYDFIHTLSGVLWVCYPKIVSDSFKTNVF